MKTLVNGGIFQAMELTWIDILAGNIVAAFWIVGVLSARRSWMERKTFLNGAILVVLLGMGASLAVAKMTYWAAELSSEVQLSKALQ